MQNRSHSSATLQIGQIPESWLGPDTILTSSSCCTWTWHTFHNATEVLKSNKSKWKAVLPKLNDNWCKEKDYWATLAEGWGRQPREKNEGLDLSRFYILCQPSHRGCLSVLWCHCGGADWVVVIYQPLWIWPQEVARQNHGFILVVPATSSSTSSHVSPAMWEKSWILYLKLPHEAQQGLHTSICTLCM